MIKSGPSNPLLSPTVDRRNRQLQEPCDRSGSAERVDQIACELVSHEPTDAIIATSKQGKNCDNRFCENRDFAFHETMNTRELTEYLRQSGFRQVDIAAAAGITPDKVSKVFSGDRKWKVEEIERLEAVYVQVDKRSPRPEPAAVIKFEGASLERMREDLPIYGTALGASAVYDGEAIEQTTLNTGEVIGYAKRPVLLNEQSDAYALYVQGESMWPVHIEGALIIAQTKRPPMSGDDVVLYLRPNGDGDTSDDGARARAVMVKRLVRKTAQYYELQQFNPQVTFRIDVTDVLRADRVLTLGDILA